MASIAVIIVNYNGGSMLRECLVSIVAQTHKPDITIVIDNDSNDGSVDCVECLDDVILLRSEKNRGFAAAVNRAVDYVVECDWVALINPDAVAADDWLFELNKGIAQYPEYVSFASRMMVYNNHQQVDGAGDAYHLSGRPWRLSNGEELSQGDMMTKEVFSACGGAALYKRDVFCNLDGFDEDFFCYLEDVDFGFRLQLHGYKCLYLPKAVVSHVGSGVVGRGSDFQVYHAHRNIVWAYFKNMPFSLLLPTLPLHILMNLYTVLVFSLRGQGKLILKAKFDALIGMGHILSKRKQVLRSRCAKIGDIVRVLNFRLNS